MSPSLTTSNGEKKLMSPPATATATTSSSSDEEKIITTTTSPNVTLKTSNGETFEVAIDVISQSQTIKHMIEDGCANEFIPLTNVDGKILAKVIEYCKKHYKSSSDVVDDEKKKKRDDEIREWDIEFMNSMQDLVTMELVLAANYLDIKGLLDLTTQKIADDIKDKSLEYVRKMFNLQKDFEPGEIERLKKECGDAGWNEADQ